MMLENNFKLINKLQIINYAKYIRKLDFNDLFMNRDSHKTLHLSFKEYKFKLNLKHYISVNPFKTLFDLTFDHNCVIYNLPFINNVKEIFKEVQNHLYFLLFIYISMKELVNLR